MWLLVLNSLTLSSHLLPLLQTLESRKCRPAQMSTTQTAEGEEESRQSMKPEKTKARTDRRQSTRSRFF